MSVLLQVQYIFLPDQCFWQKKCLKYMINQLMYSKIYKSAILVIAGSECEAELDPDVRSHRQIPSSRSPQDGIQVLQ